MAAALSPDAGNKPALLRSLSLAQGTAINMIDMVGIGPFLVVSMVTGALQGPACVLAWLLGALLAYTDGMVWSELGARWPEAGGSYVFLRKLYGDGRLGRLMPFLFVFQTVIQAPLTMASAAIGFAQYLHYLVPITPVEQKIVSGGLVILVVIVLYRKIHVVGNISMILGLITMGTILWIIGSGLPHFNSAQAFHWDLSGFKASTLLCTAIGNATLKTVYSYLGYYNVVNLGGEIKNPERNIPRSIFLSVTIIALLYVGMQLALLGNLPWQTIGRRDFLISTYIEKLYNPHVASIATGLILVIASSSLFALTLGYSRVPYAAAVKGDFFPVFAKLHPKHRFPHVSLLVLGALGFIFSLLFRMEAAITAIIVMRILIQFLSQSVGLIRWHRLQPNDRRPYRMPLYPLPAVLSMLIWLFIFCTSPLPFIGFALGIIVLGVALFFIKEL
ncbi:APC family permease [Dinghuibacter silviterrae]|uniref:Amino acid/polyamine/organocation transporter (APC superfamily) n=1 Tax=Dinghuibacter silviterrae TaxID=1539049 RepID=A0A4R8DG90_9BACT|nr:APC family permease [Dinghuibacter silviterrae]TDW96126.1 amino acid/polyamine/organocation transporter (APC superfamily) [Dinghuibacter silviterrae]